MQDNKLANLFATTKQSAAERKGIHLPPEKSSIRANLDNLRPYDRNPRQSKNEKYASIKESIRNSGMDHPPNVTARPGDSYYMVRDGGNTRLQILNELWEETKDPRFFEFDCTFYPWEGDLKTIAKHMAENEERGATLFIDRALAAVALREEILLAEGSDDISNRELARRITSEGWTVTDSLLSVMFYTTVHLLDYIPSALWGGLGRDTIKKIRTLGKAGETYWNELSRKHEQNRLWSDTWQEALIECDSEQISYLDLHTALCSRIRDTFSINGLGEVGAEIDAILAGHSRENVFPETPTSNVDPTGSQDGVLTSQQPQPSSADKTVTPSPVVPPPAATTASSPQHQIEPSSSTLDAIPDAVRMLLQTVFLEANLQNFVTIKNEGIGFEVDLESYANSIKQGFAQPSDEDGFAFKAETILAVLAQIRASVLDDHNHSANQNIFTINEDICRCLFQGNWQQMSFQVYLGNVVGETDPNIPFAGIWKSLVELKKLVAVWNASLAEKRSQDL